MNPAVDVPAPPFRSHPSKLFVEVTSRCNLLCPMCVKQSPGCGITDGDMSLETFRALKPALSQAETLILNGIGEPLLHPRLEEFVTLARSVMPAEGIIAFQSNGQLLTDRRLQGLIAAGLDRISFSLDAVEPELLGRVRAGAELTGIEEALALCRRRRDESPRSVFRVGIEFVLQRETMEGLPAALRWAAERGVDFALVTHLLAYDESMQRQAVFDRNTDEALAHYREWRILAEKRGLNLDEYYRILWKYSKNTKEKRLVAFAEEMFSAAKEKDIFFNLKTLLNRDNHQHRRLQEIMREAECVASETGIELTLPAHTPRTQRRCDFIEEGSVFISWNGDLHPCYFLWHSYSCFVTDWHKYVNARSFGNLEAEGIIDIWRSGDFSFFRNEVMNYDYPFCTNCTLAPCDYIDSKEFEQDCFTNTIPCGDCQWCLGLFHCLQ